MASLISWLETQLNDTRISCRCTFLWCHVPFAWFSGHRTGDTDNLTRKEEKQDEAQYADPMAKKYSHDELKASQGGLAHAKASCWPQCALQHVHTCSTCCTMQKATFASVAQVDLRMWILPGGSNTSPSRTSRASLGCPWRTFWSSPSGSSKMPSHLARWPLWPWLERLVMSGWEDANWHKNI